MWIIFRLWLNLQSSYTRCVGCSFRVLTWRWPTYRAKTCSCIPTVLTYLPTYSMVQSPSWEANGSAASQEIPRISRNPEVHHRTHKRPPPVSILSQPNPVHIHTSHFPEIHPNIIRSSTLRSPQWSPSLRFPHQDPVHPPLLTHTRHMPSPSHSSRFYHLRDYRTINSA